MRYILVSFTLSVSMLFQWCAHAAQAERATDHSEAISQAQDRRAGEIIRQADRIRAPAEPFRYALTLVEMKGDQEVTRQSFDVAMRFYKPEPGQEGDARALVRFVDPPSEKGKSLLSIFDKLWYYEPKLRRPIPISRQQRLVGQVSNGDVVATDFDLSYISKLVGSEDCEGRKCYRLELQRRWSYVTYPKIIYWVDAENYRPYKAEFLATNDKLIKRAWYKDYKPALGVERPHEIYIEDSLKKEQYTRMLYSDVRLEAVPEAYFQKEYLLRLR
ncbi:outer membrane lipoprotein-sorting protein [Pseudomonas sp. CAU 1711]|uniref:outer membrane lipoprotein-sorting protein n=1 Tax=Pseudomonas sp. CAU 1711 TaxID=3140356 RepID=UPI003260C4DC